MSSVTREATLDSRQDILRTAARLFQQRGYDATSMNDVAAALKLSKGGLYHHFQSKDEMLFQINTRKKDYIHFVEGLIADVQRAKASKGTVTPRAAALALLGMINWIYQWYKPEGRLQAQDLIPQYTELLFVGALQ